MFNKNSINASYTAMIIILNPYDILGLLPARMESILWKFLLLWLLCWISRCPLNNVPMPRPEVANRQWVNWIQPQEEFHWLRGILLSLNIKPFRKVYSRSAMPSHHTSGYFLTVLWLAWIWRYLDLPLSSRPFLDFSSTLPKTQLSYVSFLWRTILHVGCAPE